MIALFFFIILNKLGAKDPIESIDLGRSFPIQFFGTKSLSPKNRRNSWIISHDAIGLWGK
jgi:hypothetical protein